MRLTAVYRAYTNRDPVALVKALESFQRKLIRDAQTLGPGTLSLRLRQHTSLTGIINKVAAETGDTPPGRLAFLAGFLNAYTDYLALIVDREAVQDADAQMSVNRGAREQTDLIRMLILRTAFAHAGARARELVTNVADSAQVSESVVKFHLSKLTELNLIERLKLGPKAVSYRVSSLGEAVLARRSKPYELPLFLIGEAVDDPGLRAAMRDEIARTWPSEALQDIHVDDAGEGIAHVVPAARQPSPQSMAKGLNEAVAAHRAA